MAMTNQRWVVDSGILRKKGGDEEPQELLVFGYSCKLFRDDERAKLIDQGKHLIPWMGDTTLKIDRYDGRGALGDLRLHEPPPGGFDQRLFLTDDEYKIEQMCDEERYKSLYNNDAEESLYHEEEIKRLHQALDAETSYSQVGFNYDEEKKSNPDSQSPKQSEGSNDEDEAYIPDPLLQIPKNMTVPETQKLNAIIAKTALFISGQGNQMEILIKAKQANNPQFSFLEVDGALHPYYKYVLEAIRSGKYNPEKQPEKEESESEEESDAEGDGYLHPSLASSLKVEAAPSIPTINYKPSADCSYSMLVNKITGIPPSAKSQQEPEVIPPPPMPPIGYYPMQPGFPPFPLPPQQYSHGPVLYSANGNIMPPIPPGSQTVPIPSSSSVQTPQKEPTTLVPYGPTPPKPLSRPSFIVPPADVQIIIDKMASYVAKNGRDFESIVKNKGDSRFNFLELSHQYHGYYAHKLTIYEGDVNPRVLTEEELLQKQELQEEKQKKLEELQKKQQRMEEVQKRVKMIQAKKKNENDPRQSPSKQVTTVSFSIKKPKDGETSVIEKRSALPMEESDDEIINEKESDSKPNSPVTSIEESSHILKVEKDVTELANLLPEKKISQQSKPLQEKKKIPEKSVLDKKSMQLEKNVIEKPLCPPEKSISTKKITTKASVEVGDVVDLTTDIFEDSQKEICNKSTEEKVKEKKPALVKEKLAITKAKKLQMERRKKAAMFLSQIQAPIVKKQDEPIVATITPKEELTIPLFPLPTRSEIEIEEIRMNTHCLMSKLKVSDFNRRPVRNRSRSKSSSPDSSDRHRSHKKHKKKKSSHKSSYRESSSRTYKTKKSKKVSFRHRSRSRSPHRHYSSRHRRESSSSSSDSTSS